MKKYLLLASVLMSAFIYAQETKPSDFTHNLQLGYEMTENGYLCSPMETAVGLVLTNNRQSEIYLLQPDGTLRTLVATRGCGRYMQLDATRTRIGFKWINDLGEQAPAVLDLSTCAIKRLAEFSAQCGQVCFGPNGQLAYTIGNQLIVESAEDRRSFDLKTHVNTIALSPDGKCVALSNDDQQPFLLEVATGRMTLLSSQTGMFAPVWSADGKHVIYQQNTQTIYCFEPATASVFCVGKGYNAQWMDNERLAYTRSEYENDDVFFFRGISVCTARFDGSSKEELISSSMDCPQDVAVLKDGRLAVTYSSDDRRLSVLHPAQPDKEEVLYRMEAGHPFGLVHSAEGLSPLKAPFNGTIGLEDIPYINQKEDVPTYRSSYAYGPCACAPSTACMLLGYYHLLPDTPTVVTRQPNRLWGRYIRFSYYVGCPYTSLQTGFTFDVEQTSSCSSVPTSGGYGYMWYGTYSPSSRMDDFYRKNGVTSATRDESGMSSISRECRDNYPYSWCITSSRSSGHLILPFLCHAAVVAKGTGFEVVDQSGSMVVHDPYGNANGSTWGGTDGRHVTYDFEGFNNGHLQMYNAWGVKVRAPEVTALRGTSAESAVEKRIENGQLIIIRDGIRYNAQGAVVR